MNYPKAMLDTITALADTHPTGWRAIARFLKALGWSLDRSSRLPDVPRSLRHRK
jgi:hypothetical protein